MNLGAVLLTLAVVASLEPIERRDFTGSPLDTDTVRISELFKNS